jgi:hypothetical protein
MNTIGAELLYEKHASVDGVYADLSAGVPEYYAKCPECGNVHGMFSSVQDAVNNKVCGGCRFDRVQRTKADLEKLGRPTRKPVREDEELPSEELPIGDEMDNEELADHLRVTWVEEAASELATDQGATPDDVVITDSDYDEDSADDMTTCEVEVGGREWKLYKDEDEIEAEILKSVAEQIVDDPTMFADWLIRNHIDTDRLRRVINSGMDENETIEDPWDWLEDVYGKKDALKYACELVSIDSQGAAEECLRYDGWRHFHPRGEDIVELSKNVIAVPQF